MNVIDALLHLQERLAVVEAAESRSRPKWSKADMEAVAGLVLRPAAAEQIALGRIEGIASQHGYPNEPWLLVRNIARRALGMRQL